MNTPCPVTQDEVAHDLAHSRRDQDAELTLQVAKRNNDFDQAVQQILKQRLTLENIHDHLDFYASGPRSKEIEREQLGEAVFKRDWSKVSEIMQDVFEAFMAWETLHIQTDLEREPGLIEETLNHD